MSDTRSLFQSQPDLRKWWLAIVKDAQFNHVLLHTRSAFMEGRPTQEQIAGADNFLSSMLSLVDTESPFEPIPSPGLEHDPLTAAKNLKPKK